MKSIWKHGHFKVNTRRRSTKLWSSLKLDVQMGFIQNNYR